MRKRVGGPLVVVGAGGHGREVIDILASCNRAGAAFELLGVVSDSGDAELLAHLGTTLLGPVEKLRDIEAHYVLGIGSSVDRHRLASQLDGWDAHGITIVHPQASIGLDVRVGEGVLLAGGARVTTNVTLGRHSHLNINAVVSHDCTIGAFATLSPGVLVNGNVELGEGAFLGTGAIVLPGRRVGAWATVGAGAVVVDDVPDGVTVVGVPARPSS